MAGLPKRLSTTLPKVRSHRVDTVQAINWSIPYWIHSFSAHGKAVAVIASAEEGEKIVKAALDTFGGVHALVINEDVVRSNALAAMTESDWDDVIAGNTR